MTEREMDVSLVGGPQDWRGRTVRMPVDVDRPREEIGAYLISDHTPLRGEGGEEDPDPRAVYEPDPDPAPAHIWIFRGWFPAAATDPAPEEYLQDAD